jgi:hypothetical protein
VSNLKVAGLLEQRQLVHALVFLLLMPNVLAYDYFVPTYGRDEVASRLEVLPDEVALAFAVPRWRRNSP